MSDTNGRGPATAENVAAALEALEEKFATSRWTATGTLLGIGDTEGAAA